MQKAHTLLFSCSQSVLAAGIQQNQPGTEQNASDNITQPVHAGNQPHLPINHTDAGTALLLHENKMYSAICVMSHHRGLPDFPKECSHGSRAFRDTDIAAATDSKLPELKAIHRDLFGEKTADEKQAAGCRSVFMRLALSCLADADHGDTARHYGQEPMDGRQNELRPAERLQVLNAYISGLRAEDERSRLRAQMYQCCMSLPVTVRWGPERPLP